VSGARRYGPEDVRPQDRQTLLAALTNQWQKSKRLAVRANMDERLMQVTASVLACEGHPVVSGQKGYRLSISTKEVAKAGGSLIHRGAEIIKRGRALVETARRMRGGPVQPGLFP
jgi:hypothetical protein